MDGVLELLLGILVGALVISPFLRELYYRIKGGGY